MNASVTIIGAGLAGSEAALVLASHGVDVELREMRPRRMTPAHASDYPAELVCSNSLKTDRLPTAHGLLKAELSILGSPLLNVAQSVRIPAGSALAVDREAFSSKVLERIESQRQIRLLRRECPHPPDDRMVIIAAGPLAADSLTDWLQQTFSTASLHFYDAIAPIVAHDSVDTTVAFRASRWDPQSDDYLNCPFSEEEYRRFWDALIQADRLCARAFEKEKYFEACLPVEVAACRDYQALAYGPLRPVGLFDPRTGKRPFAVCQLRKENVAGESYNMVGFQTRLTIPEQKKVFRLVPGLENAEFLRYGSIHRNTFMHSPALLASDCSFKKRPLLYLAGQISGCEGYTESIASGHIVARLVLKRLRGEAPTPPPSTTCCGALLRHVTGSEAKRFTPSNINFGLLDPLIGKVKKSVKKQRLCERAIEDMKAWKEGPVL